MKFASSGPAPAKPKPQPDSLPAIAAAPPLRLREWPHSPEAELGVLGCCMLDPANCINECIARLDGTSGQAFYDLRHQTIFNVMRELADELQPVDAITLRQRLKDQKRLEEVGGDAFVVSLLDTAPSASNLSYYLDIVQDKLVLRQLLEVCSTLSSLVLRGDQQAGELLELAERTIMSVRSGEYKQLPGIRALLVESMGQIEDSYHRKGAVSGIATGLRDLDRLTGGLHPGELTVVAGLSSIGKTAFAMNIAGHAVLEGKCSVGVFSLEMTATSLVTRVLCSHARVNLTRVRDGYLAEEDFTRIAAAADQIRQAHIYLDDTSDINIHQLRARARRMKQLHGIQVVIVDYLQLLDAEAQVRRENREREVNEVARGCKNMAKELNVAVIALSQVNDDGQLRESRAIGQHADNVMVLEKRKEKKEDEDKTQDHNGVAVDLYVRKQRNGPTGIVPLVFLKSYTRFESVSRVAEEDVPEYER